MASCFHCWCFLVNVYCCIGFEKKKYNLTVLLCEMAVDVKSVFSVTLLNFCKDSCGVSDLTIASSTTWHDT